MDDLLYGVSVETLQQITGEEKRVIKQWKKGTRRPSESATRLIKLFFHGQVSELLGSGWNGFYFKNGMMYVPEWRNGFSADDIRALFFRCQMVAYLESEIRLLKEEIQRRSEEMEMLEVKAEFYRRQVSAESKFGLMLERCFGVM